MAHVLECVIAISALQQSQQEQRVIVDGKWIGTAQCLRAKLKIEQVRVHRVYPGCTVLSGLFVRI
jgi:hypothetical protein